MASLPFARALLASAAICVVVTLGGCNYAENIAPTGRAQAPISDKTLALLEEKQMDKDSPILVRLFKEESEAEIWKKDRSGEYALLKTYPICRWSGDLGPKAKEGDRQAPEGFYNVTPGQMNPNSQYYLAFNMGYPNAFDRAWGRTGSELMVHGDCSSRGCYAMTDEQMVEIYALAREAFFGGQKAFQVQAYPFRMTARNLARHRNSRHLAFWKMLKVGSDHFEVTHQQPKVDVCGRHYVFDAAASEDGERAPAFHARGKCPAFQVEPTIASAVAEKQQRDNAEYAQLVSSNISVVASRKGVDGGMHPSFYDQLHATTVAQADTRFNQPVLIASTTPGALPRTPNNPPAQTTVPANLPGTEGQFQLASVSTSAPAIKGKVPMPDAAPLPKIGTAPEEPKSIASLFDNLLNGSSASAEASADTTPAATPAATRTAAAKRRTSKPTHVASAPSRHEPRQDRKRSAEHKTAAATPPEPEPRPERKPELKPRVVDNDRSEPAAPPQTRTAFTSTPQSSASLLTGAQPVMPAGSFESRWSGLRR